MAKTYSVGLDTIVAEHELTERCGKENVVVK